VPWSGSCHLRLTHTSNRTVCIALSGAAWYVPGAVDVSRPISAMNCSICGSPNQPSKIPAGGKPSSTPGICLIKEQTLIGKSHQRRGRLRSDLAEMRLRGLSDDDGHASAQRRPLLGDCVGEKLRVRVLLELCDFAVTHGPQARVAHVHWAVCALAGVPAEADDAVVGDREVMASDETVLGGGRYATDRTGYVAVLHIARQWRERVWAIEGCNGIGRHIAIRLLADGEQVIDVPPKLSARVRMFATGQGRKTDATDAHSVALAGTRMGGLRPVVNDEQLAVLRVLADRRRAFDEGHTRMTCRLHHLLLELIPGGAKKDLSAAQAKALLATVRPRDAAGKADVSPQN
jgi:hypothetical protein